MFWFLFYPRPRTCELPIFAKVVNNSTINKPFDCRYCHCSRLLFVFFSLSISKFLALTDEITLITNLLWTHSLRLRYSHNFIHCINIKNNNRTMNHEVSKPKNWVSSPVLIYLYNQSAGLPTINISKIGATSFNSLLQKASRIKDIYIESFSIRHIEEDLGLKLYY